MTGPTLDPKTFATLRARAALKGYTLTRTDPADGPQVFHLERFGIAQIKTPAELLEMFNEVPEPCPH